VAELGAATCVLLRVAVAKHLHVPKPPHIALALTALVLLLALGFGTEVIGGSRASVRSGGVGQGGPGPAGSESRGTPPLAARPAGTVRAVSAARRPNIVFVLTDDLSMDLLRFMPEVQALASRGATFENYFVTDSLCCPSRASIFTGKFPHDTGVYTNDGPDGGIGAFYANGNEQTSFNIALQQAGYRTAMMGKYLNRYLQSGSPIAPTTVPPGWTEWDVAGWGYPEYDYPMNVNGTVRQFGRSPRDYLTNVITRRGVDFINASANAHKPFFLELATFTPHSPYVPAPQDAHKFPGLAAPRPPSFNALPTDPPQWLADHQSLGPGKIRRINRAFRHRAQDVQSVDRMIGTIEAALQARGLTGNTYIVFSSDNGYHTGEYRLMPGKLTAFDTDIHVPLVIAGPGVPAGASLPQMTENIDLASTFAAIAGTRLQVTDGHSLLGILHGGLGADWRDATLIEHHGPATGSNNPDAQDAPSGNPTSYEAIRTRSILYVEYDDGEREFYSLKSDPYELHNLAGTLPPGLLSRLHDRLLALEHCHGASACWAAAH
jgi:N-acetylglucosamine-6-sulfatase